MDTLAMTDCRCGRTTCLACLARLAADCDEPSLLGAPPAPRSQRLRHDRSAMPQRLGVRVQEGPSPREPSGADGATDGRLLVEQVAADGHGAAVGLQRGDLLLAIGGRPVRTAQDVRTAMAAAGDGPIVLRVHRGGVQFDLARHAGPLRVGRATLPPLSSPAMTFSEASLVAFLQQRAVRGGDVVVGIGHDAAVVRSPHGDGLVLKSDQTIEDVHFTRGEAPWEMFGRKAVARVLSDLGAIGARPVACLCSLALPDDVDEAAARAILAGVMALADGAPTSLVGGDLSRSPRGVAIDVSALGFLEGRAPLLRSGARPGDALVVTGPLGRSRDGHHLRFTPRWREGMALAGSGLVRACIDLSDGLGRDVHHLANASAVGARLDAGALPRRRGLDGRPATVAEALHDGEDFELLFAAAPADLPRLRALPELAGVSLVQVGTCTAAAAGVVLVGEDGAAAPMAPGGFQHRFGD